MVTNLLKNADASSELDNALEGKSTPRPATLGLIYRLCTALETEGINYCHWKSNDALDRSASGANDLDLLVSRADGQRFAAILHRLGFKAAEVPAAQQLPGVLNYYGWDSETDRFVHAHVHYQLVLGQDTSKNYHLPIEEAFLGSAIRQGIFKIPAPEFDFIVFVIRMVLKHVTWDAILGRQGKLSKKEQNELVHLQSQVNQNQVHAILRQHMPWLDPVLFDRAVRSLRRDYALLARLKVGRQLQSKLAAQARRSQISDIGVKVRRRLIQTTRRRVFRRAPKKRLAHGGAIIALVGGDGSGKSTAVAELYSWLAQEFDSAKIHLGKPPRAWSTVAIDGILKVGRWRGTSMNRDWIAQSAADTNTSALPKYLRLLRFVCTARDRYRLYGKARRFASNGGIVICDRYPISLLRLMDGPSLYQALNSELNSGIVKFLERVEQGYYTQIMSPELLIVLRVDPEIAVQRKAEEETIYVRARNQEIWELDWRPARAHVIDASGSKTEMLSTLKSLIWSKL